MGIIKAVLFDVIGVTHPFSDLELSKRDFAENGEKYITDVADKGESAEISLGTMNQVRRKLLTHDNSQLVSKLINEVCNGNLDSDFMSLIGAVNAKGLALGRYKAHVFQDVPDAFLKLKRHFIVENPEYGKGIYTFLNGSPSFQMEGFRNAVALGRPQNDILNLHRFIDGYFSTDGSFDRESFAPKDDSRSFLRIARYLEVNPAEIFFLSDSGKELKVAQKAGFYVTGVVRKGNTPLEGDFNRVCDFSNLKFH